MTKVIQRLFGALACVSSFAFVLSLSGPALAAPGHGPKDPIGKPGKASQVTRTITVEMSDIVFGPTSINVKAGETVRFILKNTGQIIHEFNIGTPDMHVAHQKEMMLMMQHGMLTPTGIDVEKMKMDMGGMTMKHNDPNSVLVEPGKSRELIWTFGMAENLEFACNVPGHYAAGMVGNFKILR